MHGQFVRQTEEILGNKSWFWLKKGSVKKETESLIMAAQEQALATNLMKARIYQTQEDSKCRMCRKVDESINIGIETKIDELQKSVILNTARILRKVLEV